MRILKKEEPEWRLLVSIRTMNCTLRLFDILDMNFENPTDEVLASRINTWLTAIGKNLEVVVKS